MPKMANFLEIDLFVLVACSENSLVDSQEFFKPVVTPYEMEIACLRLVLVNQMIEPTTTCALAYHNNNY